MTISKKKPLTCNNSSPGSKADFSETFLFGIWKVIVSRYNIKLRIYDIILIIYYMKGPIKNRYEINHLLNSIISDILLEYVVFILKYAILGPWQRNAKTWDQRSTLTACLCCHIREAPKNNVFHQVNHVF